MAMMGSLVAVMGSFVSELWIAVKRSLASVMGRFGKGEIWMAVMGNEDAVMGCLAAVPEGFSRSDL